MFVLFNKFIADKLFSTLNSPKWMNLLNSILEEPLDEGNENFLPTSVQIATIDIGNPVQNVIPELAKATVNIRFNDMHSSDSLIKWIDNKIEKIFSKLENASCTYTCLLYTSDAADE